MIDDRDDGKYLDTIPPASHRSIMDIREVALVDKQGWLMTRRNPSKKRREKTLALVHIEEAKGIDILSRPNAALIQEPKTSVPLPSRTSSCELVNIVANELASWVDCYNER